MSLDLGPAFTRAQAVVNGLVAAIPNLIVALVVFGGFLLVAAIGQSVVARLTGTRLHADRNTGVAVADSLKASSSFSACSSRSRSLRRTEGVLAEPAPDVLLMDFAPSSVSLRVRWWIAPPKRADAPDARDKVLTAVENQPTSHGIDLPFPTQVPFHEQTEGSDGDRARQREGWPAGNTDVPASRTVADAIRHIPGSKPRGAEGE